MKIIFLVYILFFPLGILAQTKKQTENVFIITFDGLRWQELFNGADEYLIQQKDFVKHPDQLKENYWKENFVERRKALFPFIWSTIVEKGQLYGNREFQNKVEVTNKMHFSYPGYNELLTGFADDEHINSNQKIYNPNITVLEAVNQNPKYKNKVAVFGSWDVFPYIINDQRSGIHVNAGFSKATGSSLSPTENMLNNLQDLIPTPWSSVRFDAFTHNYAVEYIKKNKPNLVYIAYGETDDFAHNGDYEQYLVSANRTDHFIQELWKLCQSLPEYKDKTTFILTTDHGRGHQDWRHHNIKLKGSDEIWLAIMGPDTTPIGEINSEGKLYLNQIAKTVAAFLGVEYCGDKPCGSMISEVLK